MTTLLVIDKEANTRLLLKDEFQSEGYEVTVAETMDEALEMIRSSKPDIIAWEFKIPGPEGLDFLRILKQEAGIPLVLCSPYAGFKNDWRLQASDAFVVQSADLTELKTVVRSILRRKCVHRGLPH